MKMNKKQREFIYRVIVIILVISMLAGIVVSFF